MSDPTITESNTHLEKRRNRVYNAIMSLGGIYATSRQLRVKYETVRLWIKRGFVPKHETAMQLAELAGVDVEELRPPGTLRELKSKFKRKEIDEKINEAVKFLRIYAPYKLKDGNENG